MSKQIYIDSNGNEVQVSGTVNTADMMPMSGNDSTKVSEAIGDLSTLTTSVTSSLVGAVNEVDDLANKYNDASVLCTATINEPTLSHGSSVSNRTYYYKKGTKVFVSIAVSGLTPNGQQELFQLPQGYRPQSILLSLGCNSNFALDDVFLIKADGWVEMRKNSTADAFGFFEFDAFA